MNDKEKKDGRIDILLKVAHNVIQPTDSWKALRDRIDKKVSKNNTAKRHIGNSTFWRRLALTLAACLVLALALLACVLSKPGNNGQQEIITAEQGLFNPQQIEQLNTAFSHVRELFGTQNPWMVVETGGSGEIGTEGQANGADGNKVIIVRLAVNMNGRKGQTRYFDVVTLPDRLVSFSVSIGENSDMEIAMKPIIANSGRIEIEINARLNNSSQAGGAVTITDNMFTSLVRVKSDGSWIDIDAIGQSLSNI